MLEAMLQDHHLFFNVHASNKTSNQITFFQKQKVELHKICLKDNNRIVIDGDFTLF